MLDPKLVGPRTLVAAPQNAVWMIDRVLGTWRAAWAKNFRSGLGEGASGHAFMTLGLPATSVYGRGEPWNNTWRHQQGATWQVGAGVSSAPRGLPTETADLEGLMLTPPPTLPQLGNQ